MSLTELETRLEKERAFHNVKFSRDGAPKANPIYDLPHVAYRFYRAELARLAPGKRVLEYGCGDDAYLDRLVQWGAKEVVSIDISDEAIECARERAQRAGVADRVSFRRMNAEELDFEPNSFDLVAGRAILHHLDLAKAYASLAKVLTSEGTAVFLEPLGHNPLINVYRHFTPHLRTEDEHPLLWPDLALAQQHFGQLDRKYFTLLSMGALAVAKVPSLFNPAVKALDWADKALFKVAPFTGRWAWTIAMILRQPKKIG